MKIDTTTKKATQSLMEKVFNTMCRVAVLDDWKTDKYDLLSKKLIAFHSPIGLIRFYILNSNHEIKLSSKDTRKLSKIIEYLESSR
jgi:hypothetical protein